MLKIKTHSWSDVDISELALFSLQAREKEGRLKPGVTVDQYKESILSFAETKSFPIVAYVKDDIIGWLALITNFPRMVFIGKWHPYVLPGPQEADIAARLLQASKKYTKRAQRERLEVLLDGITPSTQLWVDKQRRWYEAQGMEISTQEMLMVCDFAEQDVLDHPVPKGFTLKPITELLNEEIKGPFFESFNDSLDRLWQDLTEEQRQTAFDYWFDRSRPFIEKASFILLKDSHVAGFSILRPEEDKVLLGPIGIHPRFRRQGLGKALMSQSLKMAKRERVTKVYLEVDIFNQPAMQMYLNAGFKEVYKQIYYCWKVS